MRQTWAPSSGLGVGRRLWPGLVASAGLAAQHSRSPSGRRLSCSGPGLGLRRAGRAPPRRLLARPQTCPQRAQKKKCFRRKTSTHILPPPFSPPWRGAPLPQLLRSEPSLWPTATRSPCGLSRSVNRRRGATKEKTQRAHNSINCRTLTVHDMPQPVTAARKGIRGPPSRPRVRPPPLPASCVHPPTAGPQPTPSGFGRRRSV